MTAKKTIVIFGATGAVGTSLAQQLSATQPDWQVQAISRQADGSSRLERLELANVSVVKGDPFDKENVLALTKEADIIVACIGFHKYQAKYWAKHFPIVMEHLLEATIQGGRKRRFVFCDNLYAYGAGHETPISPQTPTVTPSLRGSKPQVRSQLRQTLVAHMKEYPGTVAVVGGSDFFGPHVTNTSFLGDTFTAKIVRADGSPMAVGSATTVHDFCYVPDFARALAVACADDRALDRFWICPHTIHDKTLTQIAGDVAAKAGQTTTTTPRVFVLGPFLVYLMAPFMEFMWEMIEMLPIWTKDYRVDDSDFIQTFHIQATPYDQALEEYVSFYQNKLSSK